MEDMGFCSGGKQKEAAGSGTNLAPKQALLRRLTLCRTEKRGEAGADAGLCSVVDGRFRKKEERKP